MVGVEAGSEGGDNTSAEVASPKWTAAAATFQGISGIDTGQADLHEEGLGGVRRHASREGAAFADGGMRVIYRTLESAMLSLFSPRDVCSLQDRFVDSVSGASVMWVLSVVAFLHFISLIF